MDELYLSLLCSSPPKSFCLIIHNTAVPHGFPERQICCHMAVGNNTGLSIIVWLWVSFSHTHTHKKKLLVLAWGVNVNVFNIPIKNSLFCRFFADVERCTHAVHLFCVWAYVLLHCVVVDNHSNCYIHQQWSHPQDASRYCCRFDIYDLILLSAERYYLHMKKKVHTHTHTQGNWMSLWPLRN